MSRLETGVVSELVCILTERTSTSDIEKNTKHIESVNFMTQNDIDRINKFVGLESPKNNKNMIKILLFLLIIFFMFFVGNSFILNYNLLTSKWMLFVPFDCVLVFWGVFLLCTLEKRQLDFFLYEGFAGLYLITEFFGLGYSYGIHIDHFSPIVLWILILLDIPLLLFLMSYRIRIFKGIHKKKNRHLYSVALSGSLVIVLAPILNYLLNKTQQSFQYGVATLCLFIIGYGMSMYIIFFGNFFIAKRYKDVIYLYENGEIQKGAKKKIQNQKK